MNAITRAVEATWRDTGARSERPQHAFATRLGTALIPLASVFRVAVAARRGFYRLGWRSVTQLGVPVVVVGNLTVGGSGKTPLVIALVAALRTAGYTPGVVSRGYGGSATKHRGNAELVQAEQSADAAALYGDEAVLIRRRSGAPVCVGRSRAVAARVLLVAHPDIDAVIADDGLQHYGLARDFEIAVFDARGAGNGRFLPAGPLREPLARLAEVDAVVLNGDDASLPALPQGVALVRAPFRMRVTAQDAWLLRSPDERRSLASFRGKRITAAAGIGNPARFFALLSAAGIKFHRMPLPDHYDYRGNPFSTRNSEAILITEKDAVKCQALDEPRLWVVPVRAEFDAALTEAIVATITRRSAVR